MEFNRELDVTGLNCPLPILRAKKTLSEMASGQILKIRATDPGSQRDFRMFAEQTGNALLKQDQEEAVFVYWLRRK